MSQSLKLEMCTTQLLQVLESKSHLSVKEASKEIKEVIRMLRTSNSIQESSSSMMAFIVDDLIDFSQLNAGKFKKVPTWFDLSKCIGDVVKI